MCEGRYPARLILEECLRSASRRYWERCSPAHTETGGSCRTCVGVGRIPSLRVCQMGRVSAGGYGNISASRLVNRYKSDEMVSWSMTPLRQRLGKSELKLAVSAIAIAAIAVGATAFGPALLREIRPTGRIVADVGPLFTGTASTSGPGGAPVADAWVTVFSPLPRLMSSSHNWTNITSSGEMQLFQGWTNSAGVASGFFNANNWSLVASGWPTKLTHFTTNVSLAVYGTLLTFVNSTNKWELYNYQDSIPFNPWSIPNSFSTSLYFDLSNPVASPNIPPPNGGQSPGSNGNGSGSASPEPRGAILSPTWLPGGCGTPPSPSWSTDYDGYITGPFPLFVANNTRHTGTAFPSMAETMVGTRLAADFTGSGGMNAGGAYSASTGVHASYGANASLNVSGASTAAPANVTQSFGMLYMDNVTMHVGRTTETIYTFSHTCYPLYHYTVHRVGVTVTNITDGSFVILGAALPSWYGELINKIVTNKGTASNISTARGASQSWGSMIFTATGTSNAESLVHQSLGLVNDFLASFGLGMAVMSMESICGAFCVAADVATAIGLVTAVAGFAATMLDALAGFSYSFTATENLTLIILTSVNAASHFQLIDSSIGTLMSCAAGSVNAYMPSNVVAWP